MKNKNEVLMQKQINGWANRLVQLTGIKKKYALKIAKEKLEYKEKKIKEVEKLQSHCYSTQRQIILEKMYREDPLQYIKNKKHAYNILFARKRHIASNYEDEFKKEKKLVEKGIINREEARNRARKNLKYYDNNSCNISFIFHECK